MCDSLTGEKPGTRRLVTRDFLGEILEGENPSDGQVSLGLALQIADYQRRGQQVLIIGSPEQFERLRLADRVDLSGVELVVRSEDLSSSVQLDAAVKQILADRSGDYPRDGDGNLIDFLKSKE
jgi:hypothetical protein